MCMHKIMIFPVCLGILLIGIVMTPGVFAADGCGEGTVLVDGVCQLAPQESSDGCGEGTVMVNGVCQLASTTKAKSTFMSIEPIYLVIGAIAIGGGIVGAIFAVKRGSGTPKPASRDLDEYEEKYLAKQKPSRKPAEKKETSSSCSNCGKPLKKTAKLCGGCGSPRS